MASHYERKIVKIDLKKNWVCLINSVSLSSIHNGYEIRSYCLVNFNMERVFKKATAENKMSPTS